MCKTSDVFYHLMIIVSANSHILKKDRICKTSDVFYHNSICPFILVFTKLMQTLQSTSTHFYPKYSHNKHIYPIYSHTTFTQYITNTCTLYSLITNTIPHTYHFYLLLIYHIPNTNHFYPILYTIYPSHFLPNIHTQHKAQRKIVRL